MSAAGKFFVELAAGERRELAAAAAYRASATNVTSPAPAVLTG